MPRYLAAEMKQFGRAKCRIYPSICVASIGVWPLDIEAEEGGEGGVASLTLLRLCGLDIRVIGEPGIVKTLELVVGMHEELDKLVESRCGVSKVDIFSTVCLGDWIAPLSSLSSLL